MRRIKLVLASAVGCMCALLCGAEVWLRARGFDPVGDLRRGGVPVLRSSQTPGLGYELIPNSRGFAWGVDVQVNADGFRDRSYARPKPAGTARVVVLGDSIVFGTGLAAEETFAKQLEAHLAPRAIEVLNLGVPGYDVAQEVALLEHVALAYEPDVVLVGYSVNDVGVHSLSLEYIESLERFEHPLFRARVAQWLALRLERERAADWTEWVNRDEEFTRRFAGRFAPIEPDGETEALRKTLAEYCATHARELALNPFLGWYASPVNLARLRWAVERFAELATEHHFALRWICLPYLEAYAHPSA